MIDQIGVDLDLMLVVFCGGIGKPHLFQITETGGASEFFYAVLVDQFLRFKDQPQLLKRAVSLTDSKRLAFEGRFIALINEITHIRQILSAVFFDIVIDRICFKPAIRPDGALADCFSEKLDSEPVAHKLIAADGIRIVIHPKDLILIQIHIEAVLRIDIFRH